MSRAASALAAELSACDGGLSFSTPTTPSSLPITGDDHASSQALAACARRRWAHLAKLEDATTRQAKKLSEESWTTSRRWSELLCAMGPCDSASASWARTAGGAQHCRNLTRTIEGRVGRCGSSGRIAPPRYNAPSPRLHSDPGTTPSGGCPESPRVGPDAGGRVGGRQRAIRDLEDDRVALVLLGGRALVLHLAGVPVLAGSCSKWASVEVVIWPQRSCPPSAPQMMVWVVVSRSAHTLPRAGTMNAVRYDIHLSTEYTLGGFS